MAAIALLDLLRKNPQFGVQTFNSRNLFTANTFGASTTAASFAFTAPFAFRAFFGSDVTQVACCDAGATLDGDYISSIQSPSGKIFDNEALKYSTKQYNIELRPLLSAFHWKTLGLTSLRSFLLYYLPLLEPRTITEDDDDDFFENAEETKVDLVVPFKKSVKQIARESSVITTRRILERLAVHYISRRMSWKLVKDVSKSVTRKAARGMPTTTYIFCVGRTTFRAHFLGVFASWIVQLGIDVYHFFTSIYKAKKDGDNNNDKAVDTSEHARILGQRIFINTGRCCASLICASIGAGIGATLFRPSTGQWIGCVLGDLAGPFIFALYTEKVVASDR